LDDDASETQIREAATAALARVLVRACEAILADST
jgi:hypothetical protein